ncbi:hypothetical protein [Acidianus manzaensis]|nr:hypothetical protein [Acidianus manzaensis]
MKARIEYYKPETINVDGLSLVALKKEKEEEKDYDKSLDDLVVDGSVIVVSTKDGKIVNSNVSCAYKFPFPVKIYRLGLPVELSQDSVKMNYINVNSDNYILGLNVDLNDKTPFIIVDTDNGSKIVTSADIKDVKPTIVKQLEKPKSKQKKKATKHAKRTHKKRKIKSKSSRKSRRV